MEKGEMIRDITVIIEPTGKRVPIKEVGEAVTAEQLLRALADKINLPADTLGVLIRELTHKQFLPNQSLGDAGIEDGEKLIADFMRTAGCFLPGTRVRLANNQQIPIESIKAGDELLSLNPETKTFSTGVATTCFIGTTSGYLIVNSTIKVTPSHLFFANGQWTQAGNLKVGDYLLKADGSEVAIESIELRQESSPIYLNFAQNNGNLQGCQEGWEPRR
ncbi:hypothetical protein D6779_01000 [Candidatus Parcubacteria bacterium]|nr:MAG: hypothetical protein D6779_01000 [Candidatus Parcubacteria bacterium]